MEAEEVRYIEGRKYIRADVGERWRQQRDLYKEAQTNIHREVHAARHAVKACEPEPDG